MAGAERTLNDGSMSGRKRNSKTACALDSTASVIPMPSTSDPTDQLLAAMAQHGLDPGDIIWDGRKHRFSGAGKKRGKNAWYFAYPDRHGAHFGDFSTGCKVHWRLIRATPFTEKEKARFRAEKKKRNAQREEVRKVALRNVQKVWAAAEQLDPEKLHPYLTNKGITEVPPLVQISTLTNIVDVDTIGDGQKRKYRKLPAGILLVPMYRKGRLVNLQRIYPNGTKLFMPGADPVAARYSIGTSKQTDWSIVFVCEGAATGWAIHRATNKPVICAFTASNLRAVAQALRDRFDPGEMRIAGDNDRWSKIEQQGEDIINVGVHYAREAAAATGGVAVFPDFESLHSKPTDFDDLYQREGENKVRYWLDPENAEKATILPPDGDARAEKQGSAEDGPPNGTGTKDDSERALESNDHFRCLGYNNDTYFFLPTGTGQISGLTLSKLSTSTALLHLAPLKWWLIRFDKENDDKLSLGVRTQATDVLIRVCQKKGVFTPDRIRGRGFWRTDDGGLVGHFGDRLLPPGETELVRPDTFRNEGAVYPRLGPLPGLGDPMAVSEARDLLEMFTTRAWEDDWAGYAVAGWAAIAPFCGALLWRPHVWVTGPVSCGKTTVSSRMVVPLLAGMVATFEGGSTEAGIRQLIGMDALPVVYDEPEKTSRTATAQIDGVLRLMRSASSSGAKIVKGTRGGNPLAFNARSAFLLSSVAVGIEEEADRSRVTVCRLKGPATLDPDERRRDWDKLAPKLSEVFTIDAGRRLVARMLHWFRSGRMDKTLKVIQGAASILLRDARAADQIAPLLAGAWALMSNEVPGREEALHWIKDIGLEVPEKPLSDGEQILNILLQAREMDQTHKFVTVGMLLDQAMDGKKEADTILRQLGFKVNLKSQELAVSINSEWIKRQLKGTKYTGQWYDALRTLPGVEVGTPRTFDNKFRKHRCRTIPLDTLRKTMEESD